MAKQIIEKLIDDLDGGVADTSVTFGLDGKTYEIDLSESNAKELRSLLDKYIEAGRFAPAVHRVTVTRGRFSPPPRSDRSQNQAIREWANRNGYDVSERGRIPQEVVENFHANRPNPTPKPAPLASDAPQAAAPAAEAPAEPVSKPKATAAKAAPAKRATAASKAAAKSEAPAAVFDAGTEK